MNYQKIYNNIIEKRKINLPSGYTENHHIIPRCLGGTDDEINLIKLTAREHFICHVLLTKVYKDDLIILYKLVKAVMMMFCFGKNQERYSPSRRYEQLRKIFSEIQSDNQTGSNNSQFGTFWITNPTEKLNRKILKNSDIPEGWYKGRINFETMLPFMVEGKIKTISKSTQNRIDKKNESRKTQIEILKSYYNIYNELGFKKFVLQTGYDKTHQNLVSSFAKYVPEFVSQPRKRRGIKPALLV